MGKNNTFFFIALILFCLGCTKAYTPVTTTTDYNYLVVEGTINTAPDSTTIKLSHSVKLAEGTGTHPELKATVTLENSLNNSLVLTERNNGVYFASNLTLDPSLNYRLRIKTADNKLYLSDFVPVKISPPVDSVGFQVKPNGVDIYCNTHDPLNNTHYYRWESQETWIFSPPERSNFISDGKQLVARRADQLVYRCWQNAAATQVAIGTSSQLSQDVIYQNVVNTVPSNSAKIAVRYSILVKQYSLTKEGYQFWRNIKANTENLGSIFDAQPSLLKGNIHNVNDAQEPVIGFLSVGSIQYKRIFIDKTQLPAQWSSSAADNSCKVDIAFYKNPTTGSDDVATSLIPVPSGYLAITPVIDPNTGVLLGYYRTAAACADCTLNGGINKQPSFWK